MNAAHYTKFAVATAGLVVLFVQRRYGVDISGVSSNVEDILQIGFELLGSALTAFSVWFFPNKPKA